MKPEQAQSHEDNRNNCSNSPQKLRCDGLQPSTANATSLERLDRPQNTLNDLLVNQNKCSNFSEYEIYLCDYQYKGHKWSIEIPASSFEDAEQRLNALRNGEIIGSLKLSIPIPVKQNWLSRVKKWLNSYRIPSAP